MAVDTPSWASELGTALHATGLAHELLLESSHGLHLADLALCAVGDASLLIAAERLIVEALYAIAEAHLDH